MLLMTQPNFNAFVRDHRTLELVELLKSTDDVLDTIQLVENQHSDVMSWMLDPKEGHGQGDAILKDLLAYASSRARCQIGLDDRTRTSKFFRKWTPLRIHTSSFASSFVLRELGLGSSNRNSRLDLLVVDMQNRILVVVENKAGTPQSESQLEVYRTAINELLSSHTELRGFDVALIAMDRYFYELDGADANDEAPIWTSSWVGISYDWLTASAKRAEVQVTRGNAAASLVMNYCRSETSWESPVQARLTEIACELTQSYENEAAVLAELGENPSRRWRDQSVSLDSDVWKFILQNRSFVNLMRSVYGISGVYADVSRQIPDKCLSNLGRTRFDVTPEGADNISNSEEYWGLYFRVRRTDAEMPRFTLSLHYWPGGFDDPGELHGAKKRVDAVLPSFQTSNWQRGKHLVMESDLNGCDVARWLLEFWRKASDALRAA